MKQAIKCSSKEKSGKKRTIRIHEAKRRNKPSKKNKQERGRSRQTTHAREGKESGVFPSGSLSKTRILLLLNADAAIGGASGRAK